jgi:hypothetical protein
MLNLSAAALALLRRRLDGERVEVTDESRPHYRELAEAGLMIPLHTFARGRDSAYRLTEAACDLRDRMRDATGLNGQASRVPFAGAVPSRHG